MFMDALAQIISLVGQAWTWFFQLLDGMGGAGTFITVFLGVFTINRFIDLVLMNFLYSPTAGGIGSIEAKANAIKDKISS